MTRLQGSWLLTLLACLLASTSCTFSHFARTQNLPSPGARDATQVKIFVPEEPIPNAYTVVGVIEVHPGWFSTISGLYDEFRERAAREGANGIIHMRSTRRYVVDLDLQAPRFQLDSYDTYYGDAIVYPQSTTAVR